MGALLALYPGSGALTLLLSVYSGRRRVQGDRLDGPAVPELGVERGVRVDLGDDVNMAVYHKTGRELLRDPVGGDAGAGAGLTAFPQALGRYTVSAGGGR